MTDTIPLTLSEEAAKKAAGDALTAAISAQVECLKASGGQIDAGQLLLRLLTVEIHLNALQDVTLIAAPEGDARSLAERFFAEVEAKSKGVEGQMRRALLMSGATVRTALNGRKRD